MNKIRLLFWFNLFIFIFISVSTKLVYAHDKNKNILILNSYHRGLDWNNKVEEGIFSELKDTESEHMDIKIEYMDSKDNEDNIYFQKLIDLYRYKYKGNQFDLIICTDNPAFEFLVQYKKELFPNTPIIFSGVNNFEYYNSMDLSNMTGIIEDDDIEANIKLISSLHPNTKNITAIVDSSYIGDMLYKKWTRIERNNNKNFNLNIIKDISLDRIITELNKMPSDNVLLFMASYLEEDGGERISSSEATHHLKQYTKLPIYGIWDTVLGHGAIGGKVSSGFEQGKYAGNTALKILHGESPNNIPIKTTDVLSYIFDYNELKEFSISSRILPKNSIIINTPPSVYSIAKTQFKNTAFAIVIIFIIVIIVLVINIKNRKKLEKILKQNLNFLRTLLDTIPNPIFCKNASGQYVECNTHYENFIGLKRENIINKTVFEINQGELSHVYHSADIELMKNRGTQVYESKVKLANGSFRDVLFSKASIVSDTNEVEGIVGVMLDITERKRSEEKVNRISKLKEAMLEVNQSIIGMNDIKELTDLILEKAIDSIEGAEYGSILLLTEDRNLVMVASKGYVEEKIKKFNIPLEKSFVWQKTGGNIKNTVIINNINEVDKIPTEGGINKKEKWDINSCISSPIIVNGKLYGMINIDSNKINAFSEDDLEIMEYMKNQIEIAINKVKLYEEITYLSRYDNLTNIYNRRSFKNILCKELQFGKGFSVVVFDLNGLKFVNDTYGHLSGDKYIKTFTDGLKTITSDSDVLARYGGDEFIAIFYDDIESLTKRFENLLQYFKNTPLKIQGNNVPCSFSYGIASFPHDSQKYKDLIKIADDRMYKYKNNLKANENLN